MTEKPKPEQLAQAAKELQEAECSYEEAKKAVSFATNKELDAINRLNDKQRKFDEIVKNLIEASPKGGYWHDERKRKRVDTKYVER